MTSIRAPWGSRAPRHGRDGLDALPGLPGLNGRDGADGQRGPRGLPGPVLREAPASPAEASPPIPWRADYYRDEITDLVLRVRAGPADGGGPFINLYPVRNADDLIEYVDVVPEPIDNHGYTPD